MAVGVGFAFCAITGVAFLLWKKRSRQSGAENTKVPQRFKTVRRTGPSFKPVWKNGGEPNPTTQAQEEEDSIVPQGVPVAEPAVSLSTHLASRPRVVAAVALVISLGVGWAMGSLTARPETARTESVQPAESPWTESQQAILEEALRARSSGNASKGLALLEPLLQSAPSLASLHFTAALFAAESGNQKRAIDLLEVSIKSGQRTSDALALRGALDPSMGKTLSARADYLRRAIAADPMNPSPIFELANVLRSQKRTTEALAQMEAAKRRNLPTDSQMVLSVTMELIRLEGLSTSDLPEAPTVANPFAAAYVLLRKDDPEAASRILAAARALVSEDTFAFLMGDSAFAAYRGEPELAAVLR